MRPAAVLLVSGAMGGCIAVPVPTLPHNINPTAHARPGDKEAAEIKDGVTTRAEVLLKIGEPDRVWERERMFLYNGTRVGGYVVVVLLFAPEYPLPIPLGYRELLLVRFDERGVVERHKVVTPLLHVPMEQSVEAWLAQEATSPGPSGSERRPPPGG